MRALLLVFATLTFAPAVMAQTQPCTQVSVQSVEKADPGTPVVFTARVSNTSGSEDLKYRWQLLAGTITAGQDSPQIFVDTAGLGGQTIEATVEVTARGWTCSVKKSVEIATPIGCGMAFDQYGDLKWNDEMARLDNFAIQLWNQPTSRGALITFAGNPTYKGEAAFRLQRAKNYLVKVRGIAPNRLLTTDAGYRTDLMVYLWVVPEGVMAPVLDSEIPVSEVRFTKQPPSQRKRSTKRRRA